MPRLTFPTGSLLAAMLGTTAPPDVRRAARRLRAEAAPILAVDDEIAALALGLATTEPARSSAVLAVVPPLFWLEARRSNADGGIDGWVVEKKENGLAVRGFSVDGAPTAVPEPTGAMLVPFGSVPRQEDELALYLRGLLTAVSLPELMAQMGEASPIMIAAADAPAQDAVVLRGSTLLVAISPDQAPQ